VVTIQLSKNVFYDVVAHFSVHDVVALNKYALRMDVGAVIRRLGYIMELYEIGSPGEGTAASILTGIIMSNG
jgi:predicted transcriptional regulator of viral defense system